MGIEEKISEEEVEAVKIQEIKIPKDDRELVEAFRNLRDTREFCVQLVMYSTNGQFNPQRIAQLCTSQERQKLGYLSDLILTLQRYSRKFNVLRQETGKNLRRLSETLRDSYQNWVHVSATDDFVRRSMESELKRTPTKAISYKWKVFPTERAEDVLDWLDLYHEEYFNGREDINYPNDVYRLLHKKKGFHRLRL